MFINKNNLVALIFTFFVLTASGLAQSTTGQLSGTVTDPTGAIVSGDGKSFCVALVTLNQIETEAFARANEISFTDFAELTKNDSISESVKATVERANARISPPEQIKRFIILERDFQSGLDEITPTLKLKRNVVAANFSDVLEKLYE